MKETLSERIPFFGGTSGTTEPPRQPSRPSRATDQVAPPREGGRRARLSVRDGGKDGEPPVRAWDERPLGRRLHDGLLFGFNFTVAALALVLLSPVMLCIAIAIKLDSRGPVLFRQLRVGRDRRSGGGRTEGDAGEDQRSEDLGGRPFFIYKFRTMEVNAEQETGPVWASSDDDRCTSVGRVLRRYRLDELPQLWNVIRGEMSIVGPRPERPGYVKMLRREIEEYPSRQKIRPGITGWAQVNQDADSTVDDVRRKVDYDMEYLRERSLGFDLEIMLRTPVVMIGRSSRHEAGEDRDRDEGSTG